MGGAASARPGQPSPTYEIRSFEKGDIEPALRLWETCEGIGKGPGDDAEGTARFLARNPGFSLVVEDGGSIVAAVLCGHDGRRGYLYHLGVAATHRRRGLAREIVRRCLASLRAEGIGRCQVFVMVENVAARQFWEEVGGKMRHDLHMLSITM